MSSISAGDYELEMFWDFYLLKCFTCRWMAGLAKGSAKDQAKMIVKTVEGILQENAKRAKASRPPLTFDEALTETKRILSVEMQIHPDRDLFTGDGYGPGCSGKCYREKNSDEGKNHGGSGGSGGAKGKGHEKKEGFNKSGHEAFKKKEKVSLTLDVNEM